MDQNSEIGKVMFTRLPDEVVQQLADQVDACLEEVKRDGSVSRYADLLPVLELLPQLMLGYVMAWKEVEQQQEEQKPAETPQEPVGSPNPAEKLQHVKGFKGLTLDQQATLIDTHIRHMASLGAAQKMALGASNIKEVRWNYKDGTVHVYYPKGEWYKYYKDHTWS